MKFNLKIVASTFLIVVGTLSTFAQTNITDNPLRYTANNKGKFYIYWGGNRGYYSKSDITFRGEGQEFTLHNVAAQDKPKGWHVDYINPAKMTIPQTNLRVGYFISNKYNVSLGIDHMKYVMTQNRAVDISGSYPGAGSYGEQLPNGQVLLTEKFLTFEHTDGLNYVNAEINRVDDISKIFGINNTDIVQINTTYGLGAGVLYPKTNAQFLSRERHDNFHISGWGASAKVGLNVTFLKYFFVQVEAKGGYINMPNIYITEDNSWKAKQDFNFVQIPIVFGGIFRL